MTESIKTTEFRDRWGDLVCSLEIHKLSDGGVNIFLVKDSKMIFSWKIPNRSPKYLEKLEGDITAHDTLFRYANVAKDAALTEVDRQNRQKQREKLLEQRRYLSTLSLHDAIDHLNMGE